MQSKKDIDQVHAQRSIVSVLRGRDTMLLVLAWAAGCVDAVGFLGLDHVFVANMTGNTVLLGLALGQGNVRAALLSLVSLLGFALGVACGAVIVDRSDRQKDWPFAVTVALAIEDVLLGALALAWYLVGISPAGMIVAALLALASLAMGIQSAAVRRLDVAGIATTYITGTITSLMYDIVDWLRLTRPSALGVVSAGDTKEPVKQKPIVRLEALVWLAYGFGAMVSVFVASRWHALTILLPAAALAIVIVNAVVRSSSSRKS